MNVNNVRYIFNIFYQIYRKEKQIERTEKYNLNHPEEPEHYLKNSLNKDIKLLEEDLYELFNNKNNIDFAKQAFGLLSEDEIKKSKTTLFYNHYKSLKPKRSSSNETDIRKKTIEYFQKKFNKIIIKEEYTHASLNIRNDLYIFEENDKNNLISVEIKSDKDNFDRLYHQLSAYSYISNYIYVVLDEKHLKKYEENFLKSFKKVGILVFSEGEIQEYKKSSEYDFPFLYNLIWTSEKIYFLKSFKGFNKLSSKSDKIIDTIIKSIYTYKEMDELSKSLFFKRFQEYGNIKNYTPNINLNEFINIEEKQEKFNSFVNLR